MPERQIDRLAKRPRSASNDGRQGMSARRKQKLAVTVSVLVLLALGVAAVVGFDRISTMFGPEAAAAEDFAGPGKGNVEVIVPAGASGAVIAKSLHDAGVIATTPPFVRAFTAEPKAASIQPGSYTLKSKMSAQQALEALIAVGRGRNDLAVAIPEGFRASQIYERASKITGIPVTDFEKAARNAKAIGLPSEAKGDIEGYLFPATYDFPKDATARSVLKTMVSRAKQALSSAGVKPKDQHEVLTKASLVQKEARLPGDFPKIARVLENRLTGTSTEGGKPMPLQLDSTVNYASDKTGITTTDEDRASKSPYNTYLRKGLPPGPICSPGDRAIRAVLDPARGKWTYFVTVNPDTGQTVFSTNKDDHDKAVKRFQAWVRANS